MRLYMAQEKAGRSSWCIWGGDGASRSALPWCALWLGVFLLFFLQRFLVLFHYVPLDYNEGWGASLSRWALGGAHSLYSSSDGFLFNNYPPVFFIILESISRLTGLDTIIAGRLISCLAVVVVGWLIGCIVWSATGRRSAALAGGSIFLVTACTAFHNYFGMSDPQWLAQATMLAALALVMRGD